MKYEFYGDSDSPLVKVSLNKGESFKIERGSAVSYQNVRIEGTLNNEKKGLGGFLGAIGKAMVTGESMFITKVTAEKDDNFIYFAPAVIGAIRHLEVGKNQYFLNTSAYLGSSMEVSYDVKSQSLGRALFGGTGGLFIMETRGKGDLFISSFGDILELDVDTYKTGSPLVVDNEHVLAWESTLDYNLKIASGTFGFTSGEGIVNEFTGKGKVLIQTRNVHSLADAIYPHLPKPSNNN